MMRLDAIKEMIMSARRNEAAARPFPSGVAAGDNRAGFLNASEAGWCTRQLWYDKHAVAGEVRHPYGVFDRGHAFEHWAVTYLAAGLARAGGRLLYAGAQQKRLTLPAFRLAGTPDGLIEWRDRSETVLEVKSHGAAAQLRHRPIRDACSPGRTQHRTVSRGDRASARRCDHRLRAGGGLRAASPCTASSDGRRCSSRCSARRPPPSTP